MGGFVIEMTHRSGKPPMYICSVPLLQADDAFEDTALETLGFETQDFENTAVETLEEARNFPYPTAEVAAAVVTSLPETKNVTFRVIEISAKSARAGN